MKNPKNKKSNKGITLVALVITIIVMLILSVVTVNGIFGENGLLKRVKEAKMLAILADIMENLQNNVIEITTDNLIRNKRMVSSEMMDALAMKGLVREEILTLHEFLNQAEVKNKDLDGVTLGFNGDVWVDNYKRGKVNLSPNVTKITTPNQTITVIDGTIEEIEQDSTYYLHALTERDDFVYWVNKYGEITSYFPDTMITVDQYSDVEYTAMYGYENVLKNEDFIRPLISFENTMKMGDYGEVYFRFSSTFFPACCEELMNTDSYYREFAYYGGIPIYYGVLFSDNYEDLIVDEETGKIDSLWTGWYQIGYESELSEYVNVNLLNGRGKDFGLDIRRNSTYVSDPMAEMNLYNSRVNDGFEPYPIKFLEECSKRIESCVGISDFKKVCRDNGLKGNRIYYRGVMIYVLKDDYAYWDGCGEFLTRFNDMYNMYGQKVVNSCYQPIIKYIDL